MQIKNKILIVDDEETLLLALSRIFKHPDIRIDTAESLEKARKLINVENYDVVMTDLRLSDSTNEDGFKVIGYTKNKNIETRVILWTAYGTADIRTKAFETGADYYFEKPVFPDQIRKLLKELNIG